MKVIKGAIGVVVLGVIGLVGLKYYTANGSDQVTAVIDQLNPLVKSSQVYVKVQKPERVDEHGAAFYKQKAADEKGKTRPIEFMGMQVLKENHYLKLTNKGAHVETYEEVSQRQVPIEALKNLE